MVRMGEVKSWRWKLAVGRIIGSPGTGMKLVESKAARFWVRRRRRHIVASEDRARFLRNTRWV